ncbi:deaminated glutathione amidase [Robbsia andropogonis]|uniref:deaminated glutathione amidase n=1 Tax=Robbsia andropogonis TaxID=28092 RepID=UPI003D2160A9
MKAAIGQYVVDKDPAVNTERASASIAQAHLAGAHLLVLPEMALALDPTDADLARRSAQPLDGPFVTALSHACANAPGMTIVFTMPEPVLGDNTQDGGKAYNTQVALRDGKLIAEYRKIHLYDAFNMQESKRIAPGDTVPPLLDVHGMKVGMMTCYDVRFPELARRLVIDGADVLVLPSAWIKGPMKEWHWEVLCTARALENTCYMVACGECGPRNIGASMVVDPLGVCIARAADTPTLLFAELLPERIAQARASLPSLANRRFGTPELAVNSHSR